MKLINEIGNKYGKWTVLSRAPNSRHKQVSWLCLCVCGNKRIVIGIVILRKERWMELNSLN